MSTIAELYRLHTDEEDWPSGLCPEEKEWLTSQARAALRRGATSPSELNNALREHAEAPDLYRKAVVMDWRLGVCERALRQAGGEQAYALVDITSQKDAVLREALRQSFTIDNMTTSELDQLVQDLGHHEGQRLYARVVACGRELRRHGYVNAALRTEQVLHAILERIPSELRW